MSKERTIKHIKDIFRHHSNSSTNETNDSTQKAKSRKDNESDIVLLKYVPPSLGMKENSKHTERNDQNNDTEQVESKTASISENESTGTNTPTLKGHLGPQILMPATAVKKDDNFILKQATPVTEASIKLECKTDKLLLGSSTRLSSDSCVHHTQQRRKSQRISVADAELETTVLTQDDAEVFQNFDISAFMTSYRSGRERKTNPLYYDNHELTSSGVETDDLDSTFYGFPENRGATAISNFDIQSLNISGDFAYCSGNDCEEDFDSYADDEKSESSNEVEFEVSEATLDFGDEESEDVFKPAEDKTLIYHEYGGEDFSVYMSEESSSFAGIAPPVISKKKSLKDDREICKTHKSSVGKTLRSKLRKVFTAHNDHGEKHHHLQTITYRETRIGHGESTGIQNTATSDQKSPNLVPTSDRGVNSNNNNNNIMVLDTPLVNIPRSETLENNRHAHQTSVGFDDTKDAGRTLNRNDKIRGSGIWAKVRQSIRKKHFSKDKSKDKSDSVQAVSCEKLVDNLQGNTDNTTTNPLRQYEFSDPEF